MGARIFSNLSDYISSAPHSLLLSPKATNWKFIRDSTQIKLTKLKFELKSDCYQQKLLVVNWEIRTKARMKQKQNISCNYFVSSSFRAMTKCIYYIESRA